MPNIARFSCFDQWLRYSLFIAHYIAIMVFSYTLSNDELRNMFWLIPIFHKRILGRFRKHNTLPTIAEINTDASSRPTANGYQGSADANHRQGRAQERIYRSQKGLEGSPALLCQSEKIASTYLYIYIHIYTLRERERCALTHNGKIPLVKKKGHAKLFKNISPSQLIS